MDTKGILLVIVIVMVMVIAFLLLLNSCSNDEIKKLKATVDRQEHDLNMYAKDPRYDYCMRRIKPFTTIDEINPTNLNNIETCDLFTLASNDRLLKNAIVGKYARVPDDSTRTYIDYKLANSVKDKISLDELKSSLINEFAKRTIKDKL